MVAYYNCPVGWMYRESGLIPTVIDRLSTDYRQDRDWAAMRRKPPMTQMSSILWGYWGMYCHIAR
jgi:hypothetical protein